MHTLQFSFSSFFFFFLNNEYPTHLEKQKLEYPTPQMTHQVLCYFISHRQWNIDNGLETL